MPSAHARRQAVSWATRKAVTVWPGVVPTVRMMAWLRAWSWAANAAATAALIRARPTRNAATMNPRELMLSWFAMVAAREIGSGSLRDRPCWRSVSTPVRNARAVMIRVMPTVNPSVLARNLPRRRLAARSPSRTDRGSGSLVVARITRPLRLPGPVLLPRARRVLRRTPRRAGRTVARSTTAVVTATAIAARGHVIGGVCAPYTDSTRPRRASGGVSRVPATSPTAVARNATVRYSISRTHVTWPGVAPTALSVPT